MKRPKISVVKKETIIKTFKNCETIKGVDVTEDDGVFERYDNNNSDENNTDGDVNETNDSAQSDVNNKSKI